MDGLRLQSKIYQKGYGKTAQKVGLTYQQYRPTSALVAAIGAGTLVGSLPASFNAKDWTWTKPSDYGKPGWYAVLDGTKVALGDYFVGVDSSGQPQTFCVVGMEPLLPILAILCNRVVSIFRPQQQPGVGVGSYSGNTEENQTPLVTSYPASLRASSKGSNGPVNLPGDVRFGWFDLYLPRLPGNVVIEDHDIIKDDLGNRYVIGTAELSEFGWRIQLMESET